jgi:hypothetical protein
MSWLMLIFLILCIREIVATQGKCDGSDKSCNTKSVDILEAIRNRNK